MESMMKRRMKLTIIHNEIHLIVFSRERPGAISACSCADTEWWVWIYSSWFQLEAAGHPPGVECVFLLLSPSCWQLAQLWKQLAVHCLVKRKHYSSFCLWGYHDCCQVVTFPSDLSSVAWVLVGLQGPASSWQQPHYKWCGRWWRWGRGRQR